MSYAEFKDLVRRMMEAQSSYFKCTRHEDEKKKQLLALSKQLEGQVRKELQPDLFSA